MSALYEQFLRLPSVLWVLPFDVDINLDLVCLLGMTVSVLLALGVHHASLLLLNLLLYHTLFSVGDTFMSFQWDLLLIEVGFAMMLLAPWRLSAFVPFGQYSRNASPPSPGVMWLLRLILFKLMFMSGVVKLQSNCRVWANLTAMNYHFATQCLPAPLAWYLHRLPAVFGNVATAVTFVIELPLALLILAPLRMWRFVSGFVQIALQLSIILSGNYTFFNYLTILLCCAQFDDSLWSSCRSVCAAPTPGATATPPTSRLASRSRMQYAANVVYNIVLAAALIAWIVLSLQAFHLTQSAIAKRQLATTTNTAHVANSSLSTVASVYASLHQHLGTWRVVATMTPQQVLRLAELSLPYCFAFALLMCVLASIAHLIYLLLSTHASVNASKTRRTAALLHWTLISGVLVTVCLFNITALGEVHPNLRNQLPTALVDLRIKTQQIRICNSYGLFRVMTGVGDKNNVARPEVVIEASYDGAHWIEVPFRYKPGDPSRALPIVAPHQPRLDCMLLVCMSMCL
jgi:hypothetical protein